MTKNILIASVQVPYTKGGAEVLVETLKHHLVQHGHSVDIIQLPFSANKRESFIQEMLMWHSLDLTTYSGRKVDVLICTKFPSYLAKHKNKLVWLVHQYRQVYDLFESRFGESCVVPQDEAFRQLVYDADIAALSEAKAIHTISGNVANRLHKYLGVELINEHDKYSTSNKNDKDKFCRTNARTISGGVLLPPLPMEGKYYCEPFVEQPYILSVGRICTIKRIDLMVKSLPKIDGRVKLKISGLPDESGIESYLANEIDKHNLWHRVEFLGRVSNEALLELYARAFAVYYAPYDEDYGFVTLEALASNKPVITATDSGGVLEFVQHRINGMVSAPTEQGISESINALFKDTNLYTSLISNIKNQLSANPLTPTWSEVVQKFTE